MSYLLQMKHDVEPLQFFLWYCDYVQRWSTLLPRQKTLSPPWIRIIWAMMCKRSIIITGYGGKGSTNKQQQQLGMFIRYSHKRARSAKMIKLVAIMEMGSGEKEKSGLR